MCIVGVALAITTPAACSSGDDAKAGESQATTSTTRARSTTTRARTATTVATAAITTAPTTARTPAPVTTAPKDTTVAAQDEPVTPPPTVVASSIEQCGDLGDGQIAWAASVTTSDGARHDVSGEQVAGTAADGVTEEPGPYQVLVRVQADLGDCTIVDTTVVASN